MRFTTIIYFTLAFTLVQVVSPTLTFSQECCSDEVCRLKAHELAKEFTTLTTILGPWTPDSPTLQTILDSEDLVNDWYDKKQLMVVYSRVVEYRSYSPEFADCFLTQIADDNAIKWLVHFNSTQTSKPSLPSPNFSRGFSLFVNMNFVGASDLYQSTERFSSLYSIMLGTVLGRKRADKSNRFRLQVGGSMLYQGNKTYFFISPRVEYRLKDLEFSPANIGSLKLHIQGHWQRDNIMVDTGLSLETYIFGINLITVGYQDNPGDYYIHGGIFLNVAQWIQMSKNK